MKRNRILIFVGLIVNLTTTTSCNTNPLIVKRITDFTYETTINYDYSYEEVSDYFLKYTPNAGLCSSVIVGNKIGRNLDFYYSNGTQYVLKTTKTAKRHASIGISNLTGLYEESANDGQYHEEYKILPYVTMDGINDAGIYCNMNVVKYQSIGPWSMKNDDPNDDVVQLATARIILDNCTYLSDVPKIFDQIDFFPMGNQYEIHIMAMGPRSESDKTISKVIFEFIPFQGEDYSMICKICCISNNAEDIAIVDNDESRFYKITADNLILTNFNVWQFHPELDSREERINSLRGNEMGLERYEILEDNTKKIIKEAGGEDKVNSAQIQDMMRRVYYSNFYNLYQNNFWYSELNASLFKDELINLTEEEKNPNGDIEKVYKGRNDKKEVYNEIKNNINDWNNRDRATGTEKGLWETVYTCVYDYDNKSLKIIPHEGFIAYERKLNV